MDTAANKTRLNRKPDNLVMLVLLSGLTTICAAFSLTREDDFDLARQEILLRKIGHEILLQSGDSTSRVLPVRKVSRDKYQIRFENEFTFQPDSLVKTISRSLTKEHFAENYVVTVLNCSDNDAIFGYAISKNKKDDILACSGRKQPTGCYTIDLKFQNPGIDVSEKGYLIGSLPLLAFIGLILTRSVKFRKNKSGTRFATENIKIGNTLFSSWKKQIRIDGTTTVLTAKENKLLLILAQSPNTIIERGRLQKEIWEDEGVIVGRSLDVFISKLRKKLEPDPSVQLKNIHGKGYKLETDV